MHEPVETIHSEEHEGWKVEVFQDWDASSPKDWDTLGELVAFHDLARSYTFHDRVADGTEHEAVERGGHQLLKRFLRFHGEYAVTFRFDEGGGGQARLYSSDYDGSNPSGFIVTDRVRVNELCGTDPEYHTEEWIQTALEGELETWGQYVEGDVWGCVVEDPDGNHRDSCWGFYGFDYACTEAKEMLESAIEYEARELLKISRAVAL